MHMRLGEKIGAEALDYRVNIRLGNGLPAVGDGVGFHEIISKSGRNHYFSRKISA